MLMQCTVECGITIRKTGIRGDPSGATAEKGRIILETSAKELVPGLLDIRDWTE